MTDYQTELITVTRRRGHFNFADPSDEDYCYDFNGIPSSVVKGSKSILVSIDKGEGFDPREYDRPLDFVYDFMAMIDRRYFVFGDKGKLQAFLKHMQDQEPMQRILRDKRDIKQAQDKLQQLKDRLTYLEQDLAEAEAELQEQQS